MLYNASGATLLAPNPVAVNDSRSDTYPPSHPEFDPLTSKLRSVEVGAANAGASNLSLAMDAAISNMSPFPSEFVNVHYKTDELYEVFWNLALIAIVLTNEALEDPSSPMWRNVKDAGVKTFVYKFEDPDGRDSSIISDQQQVCKIGGSYESFPKNRRHNPLFALHSYYNFLANIHTQINNSVEYGYEYPNFGTNITDDPVSKISTISVPVYDSYGVLLGVAAIDIHKSDVRDSLNITDNELYLEASGRKRAVTFNATTDLVLDLTTCSNQTSAVTSGSRGNCGPDIPIPPNGGLCAANDQGKLLQSLAAVRAVNL